MKKHRMTLKEAKSSGKCAVDLSVSDSGLSFTYTENSIYTTATVQSRQLLHSDVSFGTTESQLVVHYVRVNLVDSHRVNLRRCSLHFTGSFHDCQDVSDAIGVITGKDRPKKLLIFINPISGWKRSFKIYRTIVEPIFSMCGIWVDAIVTEDADHAERVLMDYDLLSIDALVCMGGDGSISQVLRGLIGRTTRDAGVDINMENSSPPKPRLPVGVIPGGSGNAIALRVNGTVDVETCALNIVLGLTTKSDVMILRNHREFLAYGHVVQHCGVVADVHNVLEKLRWWAAKARYIFAVPLFWWMWRLSNYKVEYIPVEKDQNEIASSESSSSENSTNDKPNNIINTTPVTQTVSGCFPMVAIVHWELRDFIGNMRYGHYHSPELASGKLLLSIARCDTFRSLLRAFGQKTDEIPAQQIEQVEVTEYHIKHIPENEDRDKETLIILDGEIVRLPKGLSLRVKIAADILELFCINDVMVSEERMFNSYKMYRI